MANWNRGDNLQHSDDEESQPQSKNTDTLASENLESCNVESVTEEKDDVETENNDSHEDIHRTEDTVESVKNTSFVKKQISEPPPKKMKKHDVATLVQQYIEQREQSAKERASECKKLEDSEPTNDPCYNFFLSMYETTKKMPPLAQHIVQTEILEIVLQTGCFSPDHSTASNF